MEEEELEIINHELIHCKQKHSLDLLFFEFLKIIMWFNPLVYIFQNRITLLHEYISDAEIVKETDKKHYFNKLLSVTFNVENISFINQFYKHSLIKKRITMITKNKSKKMKQLKYLLVVPLLLGMLLLSSFENDAIEFDKEMPLMTNESFINDFSILDKMVDTKLEIPEENVIKSATLKVAKNVVLKRVDTILPNDVPFAIIEEVPVFPGCEGTNEELRKCLQEKITMQVSKNFNSTMAKSLGLTPGVKRIFVVFRIDKEGNIKDVRARAPHKELQAEAIRVVQSIPQMKPGKQRGINVGVKYSLPIAFKVNGKSKKEAFIAGEEVLIKNEKSSDLNSVPFAIIENVPVFSGCEGTEEELRKCLQENITKHVARNFNAGLANELKLSPGLKRIFVVFKIDKNGNINEIQARAPHKLLEKEAIRVVQSIPQMKPGKQRGENVSVKYSLPIAFKVNGESKKEAFIAGEEVLIKNEKSSDLNSVPYAIIEKVPVFPGCEGTEKELRKCLTNKVTRHVNRNFNADLAKSLKLTPGVKRIFVVFEIDKEGNISGVKARAPHKSLEEEAIRVVQSLPKMTPGKQRGGNVGVKYSLPIAFKVEGEKVSKEQSKKVKEDFINGTKTNTIFEVVKGLVTNEGGQGLPGTNIVIKGTSNGAVTDYDGNFAIKASENQILIFSFIDYQTQEVKIGKESTINIVLKKD